MGLILIVAMMCAYFDRRLEARAVADTFVADSRQQVLNARAHRVGYEGTVHEAVAAYDRFDYLLANQLLLAASLLPSRP